MADTVSSRLVSRAAAGEVEAFERLLAPVVDSAYYAALGLLEDPAAAEAAVIAACRTAFRRIRGRDPDDPGLRVWFVSIVRRECRRRQGRARPRRHLAEAEPGTTQELRQAIGRLSFEERCLIVFHHYLGLSIEEVAQLERLTPETARSRLRQAAARLQPPPVDGRGATVQQDLVFAGRMRRLAASLGGPGPALRPRIDRALRKGRLLRVSPGRVAGAIGVVLTICLVAALVPLLPAFARDARRALEVFPILPPAHSSSDGGNGRSSPVAAQHPPAQPQAGTSSGGSAVSGGSSGAGSRTSPGTGSQPTPNPGASQGATPGLPPPLSIGELTPPAAEVGVAFGPLGLVASGGSAPYQWNVSGLPAGLVIASGRIQGTPTAAGPATVTVSVTDARGATQSRALQLSVAAGLSANSPQLLQGEVYVPYSASYTASGGVPPFTWSGGGAGLSVSGGGVLAGTPGAPGTANGTVTVRDALNATSSIAFSFNVAPALSLPSTGLPPATHGQAYSFQLPLAAGGVPAYSYSASGVPSAMHLDPATNLVSGTAPSIPGPYSLFVTVTDSCPSGRGSFTQQYVLNVS